LSPERYIWARKFILDCRFQISDWWIAQFPFFASDSIFIVFDKDIKKHESLSFFLNE